MFEKATQEPKFIFHNVGTFPLTLRIYIDTQTGEDNARIQAKYANFLTALFLVFDIRDEALRHRVVRIWSRCSIAFHSFAKVCKILLGGEVYPVRTFKRECHEKANH